MKRRDFLKLLGVSFVLPAPVAVAQNLPFYLGIPMPAPVNVDDPTTPFDSDLINYPASQGATEFRTLKQKLNALYLFSRINVPGQEFLVEMNGTGLYANYTVNPALSTTILYGFAANVTRTGKDNHTVGGQFSAILGSNVTLTNGSLFGVVTQVISGTLNSTGGLIAAEFAVCNLWNNNIGAKLGCNIVFKNRGDGAAAGASGLGANNYNQGSIALWITSQQRGTDGANCGWKDGIVFDTWSMDYNAGLRGNMIDAFPLRYDGGNDPRNAYRVSSILRMRSMQSIMWYDGANANIRIYLDSFTGRLAFVNETLVPATLGTFLSIDVITGHGFNAAGTQVF